MAWLTIYSSIWITLLMVVANFPFLSSRFLMIFPCNSPQKTWLLYGLELVCSYGILLGVGLYFEYTIDKIIAKDWLFYVVILCLLLVAAFPGWAYRYLYQKKFQKFKI